MWVFWNEQFYSNEQTSIRQLSETSDIFSWKKWDAWGLHRGSNLSLHIPHNTPCLPPIILHKHCLLFLLGPLLYPGEIKNKGYAKFWEANKVYYGRCEIANGQFWNWLAQGRIYSIQSLVYSWHHNSLWEKILLFWPPTWPPCHVVAIQEYVAWSCGWNKEKWLFSQGNSPN